jgi:dihydroorotate dehydrogenase
LTSGFVGFLSFFLFLGFGYFDPFHAFIAAVMFQFITLCLRSTQANSQLVEFDLHNSAAWRRAMWGQLLMILHGVAILVAGFVISSFGVTTVFVPEDLEFMQTTQEVLVETNPRLIPLVAHDRATFGGMLLSTGFAVLLTSLWGWQRGRRWLWYSLTASGTVAYVTTIAIHWSVGYVSLKHLLPAYGGLACLWLAMMLSRTWMFEDASRQE